ncbi:MAG: C4-dicarboxylate ABC transporter permease, partial [Candidatus Melainabacteria bacterium HGW-Melainabacteria-1]
CILGSLVIRNSLFDLWTMMVFGILGFLARKVDFPIPPFVLGLILGNRLETYFRQTAVLGFDYIISRPVALAIVALAMVMVVVFSRVKPKIKAPVADSKEPM